jgi:hypothetical protein
VKKNMIWIILGGAAIWYFYNQQKQKTPAPVANVQGTNTTDQALALANQAFGAVSQLWS